MAEGLISWTKSAIAQLHSAHQYIARDSSSAADQVLDRIESAVEHLEKHPSLGRPGRIATTRELVIPRTPFIVAYRQAKGGIEVLAVLHAARKWPESL
jgi:toxin ParE1/3/4